MNIKSILALDMATLTGFSFGKLNHQKKLDLNSVNTGTWNLKENRFESFGMRFINFRHMLNEYKGYVDLIAFESISQMSGKHKGNYVFDGLLATLQAWCIDNEVEHTNIYNNTLKKFATGSGRASKEDMIKSCQQKLDFHPENDNEADARWILGMGS